MEWQHERSFRTKEKISHPPTPVDLPRGWPPCPPGRDSRDVKGSLGIPLGGSAAPSRGRALPPGISGIEIPGHRASGRVRSPETFRGRGPGTFPTEVTLGSHPKEESSRRYMYIKRKPFPSARKQTIFAFSRVLFRVHPALSYVPSRVFFLVRTPSCVPCRVRYRVFASSCVLPC